MTIHQSLVKANLPELWRIEKGCFNKVFRTSRSFFNELLLTASEEENLWIAEEDGQIMGFLCASVRGLQGYIETVDIPKRARRRGVASSLMSVCEKSFKKRGLKQVRLEVHTENPAIVLYFNLGYRITRFLRDYYQNGWHAVTMVKQL